MAFIYNFLFYFIIFLLIFPFIIHLNSFMINIIVYSRYFIGTLS